MLAAEIVEELQTCRLRISVAGSIRRQKSQVNDIEIVAQPRFISPLIERGVFNEDFPQESRVNVHDAILRHLADNRFGQQRIFPRPGE